MDPLGGAGWDARMLDSWVSGTLGCRCPTEHKKLLHSDSALWQCLGRGWMWMGAKCWGGGFSRGRRCTLNDSRQSQFSENARQQVKCHSQVGGAGGLTFGSLLFNGLPNHPPSLYTLPRKTTAHPAQHPIIPLPLLGSVLSYFIRFWPYAKPVSMQFVQPCRSPSTPFYWPLQLDTEFRFLNPRIPRN